MKCFDCNTQLLECFGDITVNDNFAGLVSVPGVEYKQCPVCRKRLYTLETARKIDEAKKRILRIKGFGSVVLKKLHKKTNNQLIFKTKKRGYCHSFAYSRFFAYKRNFTNNKLFVKENGNG